MSTTCNIVSVLAENENYWGMHVIDSLNLSTGIGLQIIKAAEMVKEGIAAETVVERIESDRHKVRASFVIDTLTYLARGGRCTTVTALLANTLKLKPKIIVKNGEMSVDRKYRGSIQTVTMKYAHDLEKELLTADHRRVFITHSGASEAVVNEIRKYLESLKIFDEILETRAGGVISSHCGPNTLGILYYMQ
jgi:DegV family protein with EDD domain